MNLDSENDFFQNPKNIYHPDFDGLKANVLGVKIGDSADKIPDFAQEYRISYNVDNKGIIYMIYFHDTSKWQINNEKEALELLGEPDEISRSNGASYFYLKKNIKIDWNPAQTQCNGFCLGNFEKIIPVYTIKDFLELYFEYKGLFKDESKNGIFIPHHLSFWASIAYLWRIKSPQKTKEYISSLTYRKQEIISLLKAFFGTDDINYWKSGDFILSRNFKDYQIILDDIRAYAHSQGDREIDTLKNALGGNGFFPLRIEEIKNIFGYFLRFHHTIYESLTFNRGWISAGSIVSRYIITRTGECMTKEGIESVEKIEYLLAIIADPLQRSFRRSELVKNYGFPDIDIDRMEIDEF